MIGYLHVGDTDTLYLEQTGGGTPSTDPRTGITLYWANCFTEDMSWRELVGIEIPNASAYVDRLDELIDIIRFSTKRWDDGELRKVLERWHNRQESRLCERVIPPPPPPPPPPPIRLEYSPPKALSDEEKRQRRYESDAYEKALQEWRTQCDIRKATRTLFTKGLEETCQPLPIKHRVTSPSPTPYQEVTLRQLLRKWITSIRKALASPSA